MNETVPAPRTAKTKTPAKQSVEAAGGISLTEKPESYNIHPVVHPAGDEEENDEAWIKPLSKETPAKGESNFNIREMVPIISEPEEEIPDERTFRHFCHAPYYIKRRDRFGICKNSVRPIPQKREAAQRLSTLAA